MAEASDLDRLREAFEQGSRAEAVANRAGADPPDVRGHLQERVERDDLMHLAAANVHVVGERIGELRSDRTHLPPDPPEVVEQACSLVRADDLAGKVPCGPDPEPVLEALRSYEDAGLDHVHLHQVGPDQAGFLRFWEREIRPKL